MVDKNAHLNAQQKIERFIHYTYKHVRLIANRLYCWRAVRTLLHYVASIEKEVMSLVESRSNFVIWVILCSQSIKLYSVRPQMTIRKKVEQKSTHKKAVNRST